jgi:hypothetical protein
MVFSIDFPGVGSAECVRLGDAGEIRTALGALGLHSPRPVVVLVGGAGGVAAVHLSQLRRVFRTGLVPAMEQSGAVGMDGGTHSGVMRLFGEARAAVLASFPLVGVACAGTVRLPGGSRARGDAADLDPRHTHYVLVPGAEWGCEAPWIARIAAELAGTAPSVTVLVNGGEIAYSDVRWSVEAGRTVLAVAGSGRAADEITAALRGEHADERAVRLAATGLVRTAPAEDPSTVAALVTSLLSGAAAG